MDSPYGLDSMAETCAATRIPHECHRDLILGYGAELFCSDDLESTARTLSSVETPWEHKRTWKDTYKLPIAWIDYL